MCIFFFPKKECALERIKVLSGVYFLQSKLYEGG